VKFSDALCEGWRCAGDGTLRIAVVLLEPHRASYGHASLDQPLGNGLQARIVCDPCTL
jgi:hypothetical protein